MSTIFVGGSRHIATIPADVARRIENIMERRHDVIIGDAPGADAAVQRYMKASNYRHVRVFCSGRRCRNNLDSWSTRPVAASAHARGFQFSAASDRVMAHEASFGLMVWDGTSVGTLANTTRLAQAGKPTVLFDASQRRTFSIRAVDQWRAFAASISPALLNALRCRVSSEGD